MPKQVQLSDEAYKALSGLKGRGESFSDVVRRLVRRGTDLTALRDLGPRLPGWDDEAFHRKAAVADRRRLEERVVRRGRPR